MDQPGWRTYGAHGLDLAGSGDLPSGNSAVGNTTSEPEAHRLKLFVAPGPFNPAKSFWAHVRSAIGTSVGARLNESGFASTAWKTAPKRTRPSPGTPISCQR